MRVISIGLTVALLMACGGKTEHDSLGPSCPASTPLEGASCTVEGVECEYGNDVRSSCNAVAACAKGAWTFAPVNQGDCPTPPNLGACPASAQPGAACDASGLVCNYSTAAQTRECFCIDVAIDGGSATWQCSEPASGCPSARPTIGATCGQPSLTCDYAACGVPDGLTFQCSALTSTWIAATSPLCISN